VESLTTSNSVSIAVSFRIDCLSPAMYLALLFSNGICIYLHGQLYSYSSHTSAVRTKKPISSPTCPTTSSGFLSVFVSSRIRLLGVLADKKIRTTTLSR
jgi:hypothetical protein